MSTAHRPTWDPAQAKDVKGGSRQFSVRDMAAHTKLKFRSVILITHWIPLFNIWYSQVGQTSSTEVARRDLRAELLLAEAEARNKKRKAEGKAPLPIEGLGDSKPASSSATPAVNGVVSGSADNGEEEANKRRKLLQEALELDRDDDEEEEENESESDSENGGGQESRRTKGKAVDEKSERWATHLLPSEMAKTFAP